VDPTQLPVYEQKQRILDTLSENQVIVVESPTGTGKTTQIPQILYNAGYARSGMIGVTQPRRIAAVSVCEYIAWQLGKTVPEIIGYKMRFDDHTDPTTQIKIMTDGILLQEIKADYHLSRYNVIMVDEAHERSLNIDFILGLLKRILGERPSFKVIISSATINAEVFSEYFDECPIVKIDAKAYPVKTIYEPPKAEGDYDELQAKIQEIVSRDVKNGRAKGDFLVFLSGVRAIKDCIAAVKKLKEAGRLEPLPLYARLSSDEQEKVFQDYPGKLKVIVSTNIAETSVTIDGVTTVIDSGLAKMNFYNKRTFTSSLVEVPISRASCNQRKGRAGRTAPGNCYRLYTRQDYDGRPLFTTEEIYRTDLSEVVLRMAELGIRDFESFDFLSQPDKPGILSAVQTLMLLEALDERRELTRIGQMMTQFPMLPQHSRAIVEAIMHYPNVIEEVLIAASFLTTNNPFLLPIGEEMEARKAHHAFRDPYGDFISYLKIYRGFLQAGNRKAFCDRSYLDMEVLEEIVNIKEQLEEIVSTMGVPILSSRNIREYLCAVSRGLIQFVCRRSGRGIYSTLTAGKIFIHPGSVMFQENPEYIVAGEIVKTTRMYARSVSKLNPEWIRQISPQLYDDLVRPPRDKKALKQPRDFTNQIKIGNQTFRIDKDKGRKVVLLPWDSLKRVLNSFDPSLIPDFKNLRGKILYRGYEILSGVRLNSLINVARKIDPARDTVKSWPRGNYSYPQGAETLCGNLDKLSGLCSRKKKSKRMGFLALYSDGDGHYWFKCVKSFHGALSESLASLDCLADEVPEAEEPGHIERINATFRRLSKMLET